MANKNLFSSVPGPQLAPADTVNEAGGIAYSLPSQLALAQLVCTGCFNGTYYTDEKEQLTTFLDVSKQCSTEFLAKLAVYARSNAYMKDSPAMLCAILTTRGSEGLGYLKSIFPKVINNGKMLRTFCQVVRSGQIGRKSFGTSVKNMIRGWFSSHDDDYIFRQSVGNSPTMGDIIKMVHPVPETESRAMLYRYLIGKEVTDVTALPKLVQTYLAFLDKKGEGLELPDLPFQMLMSLPLTETQWKQLALQSNWTTLRMNLNTFARHGVFEGYGREKVIESLAQKLCDPQEIKKSKVFPYQLFAAYVATQDNESIPGAIREALGQAAQLSLSNVPIVQEGSVVVGVDVSGSMNSPVTGYRTGATTAVTCTQAASLIGAAFKAVNPATTILPFDTRLHAVNSDLPLLELTHIISRFGGGGTDCSLPLKYVKDHLSQFKDLKLFVMVSDNCSWADFKVGDTRTQSMQLWNVIKSKCPQAKLVNLDLQPYTTSQFQVRDDILNLGGFSDQVFNTIDAFANSKNPTNWVAEIERVVL